MRNQYFLHNKIIRIYSRSSVKISPLISMFHLILINFYLGCFCLSQGNSIPEDVCQYSKLISDGIGKSLKFYSENYPQINVDGLLGYSVLENHLYAISQSAIQKKCPDDSKYLIDNLIKHKASVSHINPIATKVVRKKDPVYYDTVMPPLLSFAEMDFNWTRFDENRIPTHEVLKHGFYQGRSGDLCLHEIYPDNCSISENCYNRFVVSPQGWDYVGTHQLIYYKIYHTNKCFLKNPSRMGSKAIKRRMEDFCINYLKECNDIIIGKVHKLSYTLDFFLEMILVCGGQIKYTNFFPLKFVRYILKHQDEDGCLREVTDIARKYMASGLSRPKRLCSRMKDFCDSHVLGLGSAVLGIFLNRLFAD